MSKPRTRSKVITGHREMIEYLEQRRLVLELNHADLRSRIGRHTGFNYAVSGRSDDLKMATMFALLRAMGLEIEVRPTPMTTRAQRVMAARKSSLLSAGSEDEGPQD